MSSFLKFLESETVALSNNMRKQSQTKRQLHHKLKRSKVVIQFSYETHESSSTFQFVQRLPRLQLREPKQLVHSEGKIRRLWWQRMRDGTWSTTTFTFRTSPKIRPKPSSRLFWAVQSENILHVHIYLLAPTAKRTKSEQLHINCVWVSDAWSLFQVTDEALRPFFVASVTRIRNETKTSPCFQI